MACAVDVRNENGPIRDRPADKALERLNGGARDHRSIKTSWVMGGKADIAWRARIRHGIQEIGDPARCIVEPTE